MKESNHRLECCDSPGRRADKEHSREHNQMTRPEVCGPRSALLPRRYCISAKQEGVELLC